MKKIWLVLLCVSSACFAQFKGLSCSQYQSKFLGRSVKYCIHRSHQQDQPRKGDKIAYFMHGLNGDSRHWEKTGYAEVVDTLSQKSGFPQMTFVSFDTAST